MRLLWGWWTPWSGGGGVVWKWNSTSQVNPGGSDGDGEGKGALRLRKTPARGWERGWAADGMERGCRGARVSRSLALSLAPVPVRCPARSASACPSRRSRQGPSRSVLTGNETVLWKRRRGGEAPFGRASPADSPAASGEALPNVCFGTGFTCETGPKAISGLHRQGEIMKSWFHADYTSI